MNIVKENSDALNAVIKLTIGKEDYEPKVAKVLADYRKKANIKGFRPGKVPMNMIQQMYGKTAKIDEVNKLVSESLPEYIFTEKLNILGEPLPSDLQKQFELDKEESFEFCFDIGLAPEVNVEISDKDEFPFYTITVDDQTANKQIDTLKQQFGSVESFDIVDEDSLLRVNLSQIVAQNEEAIKTEASLFDISKIKDDKIKKQFLGANKTQLIEFDIVKALENPTEISSLLSITKEEVENLSPIFVLEIIDITKFKPAELNEEFYTRVFGKGIVSTEEEFITKVKNDIGRAYNEDSNYRFGIDARDILVEKYKLELPDTFLKKWLMVTDEKKELTEEKLNEEYPFFAKSIAWQVIRASISEAQGIKFNDDELLDIAKEYTLSQFRQYGIPINSIPEEQLVKIATQSLEREEDKRKMVEQVIEKKVFTYIRETATLNKKEISLDDFKKLYETKDTKEIKKIQESVA